MPVLSLGQQSLVTSTVEHKKLLLQVLSEVAALPVTGGLILLWRNLGLFLSAAPIIAQQFCWVSSFPHNPDLLTVRRSTSNCALIYFKEQLPVILEMYPLAPYVEIS